jgi:hypothetical protein
VHSAQLRQAESLAAAAEQLPAELAPPEQSVLQARQAAKLLVEPVRAMVAEPHYAAE